MKFINKTKIFSSLPQIFALLFVLAFTALAWTEPTVAPPGGNVSTPLNVGSTGQSKAGGLILNTGGAANGLIVDQGKVGIGTANPGQKLSVAGIIESTLGGFKFPDGSIQTQAAVSDPADKTGYTEGLVQINYTSVPYCACLATNCSAIPPGYCADTYVSWNCFSGNIYAAGCLSGWTQREVARRNGSGGLGTCVPESVTSTCYKPPVASFCGNGVLDPGEVCDDGNDSNGAGDCAADCSRINAFLSPYKYCTGLYPASRILTEYLSGTIDQYCKEQGFSGNTRSSAGQPTYPSWGSAYQNGQWVCSQYGYRVDKIWCQ